MIETNHTINLLMALRPAETNAPITTNAVIVAKNSTHHRNEFGGPGVAENFRG